MDPTHIAEAAHAILEAAINVLVPEQESSDDDAANEKPFTNAEREAAALAERDAHGNANPERVAASSGGCD